MTKQSNNNIAKMWMLKAIEDVAGNYITYHYNKDTANGTVLLDKIEYAGHVYGDAPFAEVEFNYVTNSANAFAGYYFGEKVLNDKRLDDIVTRVDGVIHRKYQLHYDLPSYIHSRTYLTSIEECARTSQFNSSLLCKPQTHFEWQKEADSSAYNAFPQTTSLTSSVNFDEHRLFDINGDGVDDIVYVANNAWRTKLTGGNYVYLHDYGSSTQHKSHALVMDVNSDGVRELVLFESGPVRQVSIVNGNVETSTLNSVHIGYSVFKEGIISADVNGDGREDMVFRENGDVKAYIQPEQRNGQWQKKVLYTFASDSTPYVRTFENAKTTTGFDVNGDGRTDFIFEIRRRVYFCQYGGGGGVELQQGQLPGGVSGADSGSYSSQMPSGISSMPSTEELDLSEEEAFQSQIIDFNSVNPDMAEADDTMQNIVHANTSNEELICISNGGTWTYNTTTNFEVFTSTGSLSNPSITPRGSLGTSNVERLTPVDFNGDGLVDVAFIANNQWRYRLSTGTYFQIARSTGLASNTSNNHRTQFADVNQDGRTDILYASNSTTLQIYMSKPHSTDNGQVEFQWSDTLGIGSNNLVLLGFINQDSRIDLVTKNGGTWKGFNQPTYQTDDTIKRITNGFGVKTDIVYRHMTDSSVYIETPNRATLPDGVISPASGPALVYTVSSDITDTAQVTVQYGYGNNKLHIGGRGPLGFGLLKTTDLQTSVVTETTYHQQTDSHDGKGYALVGMPLTTSQKRGNVTISYSSNQFKVEPTASGGNFPYIDVSTEDTYLVDTDASASKHASRIITDSDHDGFGNLTKSTVTTKDPMVSGWPYIRTITENTYGSTDEEKRTGRLSQTTVTKIRGNRSTVRQSEFGYYSNGMLSWSIQRGDNTTANYSSNDKRFVHHDLKTMYGYDQYGNKTRVCTTPQSSMDLPTAEMGSDGMSMTFLYNDIRCADTLYYFGGRFVEKSVDGFNNAITYEYNGSVSAPSGLIYEITSRDANGVASTQEFDTFGRETKTIHPDGRQTSTTQTFSSAYGGYFMVTNTQTGAPTTRAYIDKWGREIATTQTYRRYGTTNGTLVVYKTYDDQGRLSTVSEPNEPNNVTTTLYDVLGRTKTIIRPDNEQETIDYIGEHTITTNALGQQSRETKNGFGETVSSTNGYTGSSSSGVEYNKTVYFVYDEYSQLISTNNNFNAQVITTKYDSWGRKVETNDPDKGVWEYQHNAYGELTSQTDAEQHVYTFIHDRLGRMIKRYSPSEGTACWGYGNSSSAGANKIGRLVYKASYPNANAICLGDHSMPSNASHQLIQFTYDDEGRIIKQNTVQAGLAYNQETSYDPTTGKIDVVTMNAKENEDDEDDDDKPQLAVKHEYDSLGNLYRLRDNATNVLLWEAMEYNTRGLLHKSKYGNGAETTKTYNILGMLTNNTVRKSSSMLYESDVVIDEIGNVKERKTYFRRTNGFFSVFRETYSYDALNRIKSRSFANIAGTSLSGNFTSYQSFNYNSAGNLTFKTGVGHYKYGNNSKPNRLSGVYSNSGFYGAPLKSMQYDDNGNMTNDGTRSIDYTAFNKPSRITKGSNIIDMTYGVDRNMTTKVFNRNENGSQVITTHNYIGGYEKIIKSTGNGFTEHKFHIMGGNIVVTKRSNNTSQTYFMHKDTQGSVGLVTDMSLIATMNDGIKAQYIYEPFGKQTSLHLDSVLDGVMYQAPSHQGYTGHHEMGDVDIIHMGGRIYDPTLGRFLQADPHIQAPHNTQNYNRYSYVLNNPMSYTDPSGYFFKKLGKFVKKHWRTIASIVIAVYLPGVSWIAELGTVGAGALTGFVSGAVATGSLKGALVGAFTGGMFGELHNMAKGFTKVISHGAVGGIGSVLSGGKFGHGFLSAGFTQAVGNIEGMFVESATKFADRATNAIKAAAIGGTASALSGGKFANGAVTGAFSRLLNDDAFDFKSLDDKKLLELSDPKLEISLEAGGNKLIGLDSNGEVNGPEVALGKVTVDNKEIVDVDIANVGRAALKLNKDGLVAGAKACTHGTSGACAALSLKVDSEVARTVVHNVNVATTPQLSPLGQIRLWWRENMGVPNNTVKEN